MNQTNRHHSSRHNDLANWMDTDSVSYGYGLATDERRGARHVLVFIQFAR